MRRRPQGAPRAGRGSRFAPIAYPVVSRPLSFPPPRRPAEDERRVPRVEDGHGPVHGLGRTRAPPRRRAPPARPGRACGRVASAHMRCRANAVADVSRTLYWFATTAGMPPARSAGAMPRRKSLREPRPVSQAFRTTSLRPRPERRRRRRSASTHVERPRPSTRRSAPVLSFSSHAPCPAKWRTSKRRPGELAVEARGRRGRQDVETAWPDLTSGANAARMAAVSWRAETGVASRGWATATRTRSGPRRAAGASGGIAPNTLRTRTASSERKRLREGSHASSHGLSAIQSSEDVNASSRGRFAALRAASQRRLTSPGKSVSNRTAPYAVSSEAFGRSPGPRPSSAREDALVERDDPAHPLAGGAAPRLERLDDARPRPRRDETRRLAVDEEEVEAGGRRRGRFLRAARGGGEKRRTRRGRFLRR